MAKADQEDERCCCDDCLELRIHMDWWIHHKSVRTSLGVGNEVGQHTANECIWNKVTGLSRDRMLRLRVSVSCLTCEDRKGVWVRYEIG